jgi:uncharacterized membrane protein
MDSQETSPPPITQEMVEQNVDAIMALQSADAHSMSVHQRRTERIASSISVPAFLYGMAIMILAWVSLNLCLKLSGRLPYDPPPFAWLQTAVSVVALLMTTLVIVTQTRQGKIAERNAHLDLQINLLVDQKVAKIIQLLEELRVDSPSLPNRQDLTAEQMQVAVNPNHVVSVITDRMDQKDHGDDSGDVVEDLE